MSWKFWQLFSKKKTVLGNIPPPPKKDYFRGLVSFFVPVRLRKLKNRQRGLRKGLSCREWEKENGRKWVVS